MGEDGDGECDEKVPCIAMEVTATPPPSIPKL